MSHPKSFQVSMDAIFSEPGKTVAAESVKARFGLLQFFQRGMQSAPQEIRLREKTPFPVLKEKAGSAVSDKRFEQCRQLGAEINVSTSGIGLEKQFYRLTGVLAELRTNIVATSYDRAYFGVNFGDTTIDLTMETRGPEHIEDLSAALKQAGYVFERIV